MAASSRSIFKSTLFWIALLSLLFSVLFIFFGQRLSVDLFGEVLKRILYSTVFFLGIIILELLYLFLTKEEEREGRRARREASRIRRKEEKAQLKLKKKAVKALAKKFYEALSIIKKSNIYQKRASYNYELPWYLVLGGEEEEQKAILKNSGLDFPINIEYKEQEENKGAFQWFFAEEGVFVTVPKAYTTLEKNAASDPIWLTFLKLFKKERWRRPINGIIFTVNGKELLENDEVSLNEFAKVIREKLNEVSKTFSSQIPIYMIISGVEEIPAFYAFFNNLTPEEKREILGITFEDTTKDISGELIDVKFSSLLQKLEHDTLGNLQNSWERQERKEIFFFVEEFRSFLEKVSNLAEKTFSKTRYYMPLMLRGIYFTDITHTMGTRYALTTNGAPLLSGMFLPKVFERIILSETQLVKVNDTYRKKFGYLWGGLLGLTALLVAGSVYYWSVFVKEEQRETKEIEDIYIQYKELKSMDKPKVTVTVKHKVRKVDTPVDAMQIGKLGGKENKDVSFRKGSAELTTFAQVELQKMLTHIQELSTTSKLKILGHTDSIGDNTYNLELSQKRAASVKKFFVKNGITSERITTKGIGEASPIATNQTVEGRRLNRRVEIYAYGIQTKIEELSYEEEEYIVEDNLSDLQRILAMLDALRSMRRDKKNSHISDEPWKPGYYKIDQRDTYVRALYGKGLESLLLPRVTMLIEKELLLNLTNKIGTQENLKAYLMLADKKHLDPQFLEGYMLNRWGDSLEETEIRRLNIHFSALLKMDFSPAALEHKSIRKARKKLLAHAGTAGVVYKALQQKASRSGLHDFQFIEVLDAYPDALTGTDYRIPGLYTKEGYEKIILLQTKSIIKEAMTKSWILGEDKTTEGKELARIYEKVLSLYFIDYRRYWTKGLAQIGIPAYHSSSELSRQLELLSSGLSPITLVLRAFKVNTYLLTPKERAKIAMKKKQELGVTGAEIGGRIGSKLDRIQRLGTKGMKEFASDKMVYDLRTIFKPYHELIDEKNKPSRKFQIVLRHVEKVYQQMLEVDTSAEPKQSAFEIVSKKGTSSHQTFALKSSLLPPRVLSLYNKALKNSWDYLASLVDGHLNKTYNDEIWNFYQERIEGRFPLNLHTESDITLDDFKTFFQKEGILDQFFAKFVSPFVVVNTKTGTYKIKAIDGAKVSVDKEMVQSMIQAKEIQKLFFQSSGNLQLGAVIKPKYLSNNLTAMDIIYEEQELVYEHGPTQSKAFVWPSQYPDSLAKFTFYDSHSNRVVKIRGEGPWALLRLFSKLHKKILSPTSMLVSYRKGPYRGSFIVKGNLVKLYGKSSPTRKFLLKKK